MRPFWRTATPDAVSGRMKTLLALLAPLVATVAPAAETAAVTDVAVPPAAGGAALSEEFRPKPEFAPVRALLAGKKPLKWLFLGDSITMGSIYTDGARDYTQLFAERVRMELARKQDIVINSGVSGDNTERLIEGFDWRVRQFQPDVVFLMIGMNDITLNDPKRSVPPDRFRANLHKLVGLVRERPPGLVILQTTCPILPGSTPDREPQFEAYMTIVREVARETACPLIDHAARWREAAGTDPAVHSGRMGHGCHPNAAGHRAFAGLIFRELGIFNPADPRARTCRLPHP